MNIRISCVVLVLVPLYTYAYNGVDIDSGFQLQVEDYSCLLQAGFEFVVFRAYRKVGVIDYDSKQNIINAWKGGMKKVDIYIFPCVRECATDTLSISPRQQIRDMMNYLTGVQFGNVYLDIEGGWWYNAFFDDVTKNQNFVREMVDEIIRYGHTPGFYSNWNYWKLLLGGDDFTEMAKYPMWYIYIYICNVYNLGIVPGINKIILIIGRILGGG